MRDDWRPHPHFLRLSQITSILERHSGGDQANQLPVEAALFILGETAEDVDNKNQTYLLGVLLLIA